MYKVFCISVCMQQSVSQFQHTRSDQHRDFVRNDHNYQSLDNMIHVGSTMDKFLNDVIKYGCHHYPAEADGR